MNTTYCFWRIDWRNSVDEIKYFLSYVYTFNILPSMKRYLEVQEIQAHFFICYFLYGKVKFGSKGYSEKRLGEMTAYKSVMGMYGRYIRVGQRVKSDLVLKDFEYLRYKAIELPDDGFKKEFLSVFEQLDLHHYLQACSHE